MRDDTSDDDTSNDDPVEVLRDSPVGVNDPNIVGDAGPLDQPPGQDPPDPDALADPDAVPQTAEEV